MNFNKDLKIARLQREIQSLKDDCIVAEFVGTSIENDANENGGNKFAKFSDKLSPSELKTLRNIENDSSSDRPFIRTVLLFLYPHESLQQLQQKSLFGCDPKKFLTKSGVVKRTTRKLPLTPEKVGIMKKLFSERIAAANLTECELVLRTKPSYFNQLVATALSNLHRKMCN